MNKIIISGISGFVGENLRRFLEPNNDIVGLSRSESKEEYIYTYDELSSEILNQSIAFIHLAGKAHDLSNVASENEYFDANTELTKELYDKWLISDSEVFIFMSSVKAAADTLDIVLTENHIPNPKTAYGKSKLAAENYVLNKKLPEGKRLYILRPCMIHGAGNKGNLNLLYNIISKKIPYPLGSFKNSRSFVHVDNLSQVINQLIYSRAESGIYNVSDDEPISTNDLVVTIGEALNIKVSVLRVPKAIIKIISYIGDVIPLPINSDRLKKLTENYVVSNKKIKDVLDSDIVFDTKIGIIKTIKSFKEN